MNDDQAILVKLQAEGRLRTIPLIRHDGPWILAGGNRLLNLSSNDYLGLAARADWTRSFLDSEEARGCRFSSSSSRLLTGNCEACEAFEADLASDLGHEAALLFNSGYHANTGILPALVGKHDLILADKLVHASLIDGLRLTEAPYKRFRHNDYDQLERLLETEAKDRGCVFVVVESVYSMDGDTAELPRLVGLKRRFPNVLLYVDEAHAIGVRGRRGLGLAEEQGCLPDVDFLVGTLGKALASMGAYVACSKMAREVLVNKSRPLIFSTALPPLLVAWSHFVWRRLGAMEAERRRLAHLAQTLAETLRGRGGETSRSHIVPWIVGGNEATVRLADALRRKGFYCLPVRPPTVPLGTARLRFSLTAHLPDEDFGRLRRTLEELQGNWRSTSVEFQSPSRGMSNLE